ncbi:Uncharacterised protein [Escherichia coli]|nr:Uncharacterised protein [Escherichia coli]CAD5565192.1 Uncharacterised protein [Escherichia coli]
MQKYLYFVRSKDCEILDLNVQPNHVSLVVSQYLL